jgi:integrase
VFTNPLARVRTWSPTQQPPLPLDDLAGLRAALDSPNPARALLAALAAFHGLRTGELLDLKLVDVRDRHLHIAEPVARVMPLAEPVQRRPATYLDHRSTRWPNSTNPHLFIHFRTAARSDAVGRRWIKLTLDLPGTVQAIRRDRILHEALATGGDTRRICDLFGLSINTASRYTDAIREPRLADPPHRSEPVVP